MYEYDETNDKGMAIRVYQEASGSFCVIPDFIQFIYIYSNDRLLSKMIIEENGVVLNVYILFTG